MKYLREIYAEDVGNSLQLAESETLRLPWPDGRAGHFDVTASALGEPQDWRRMMRRMGYPSVTIEEAGRLIDASRDAQRRAAQ